MEIESKNEEQLSTVGEGYLADVDEVAKLLDISRTRLSQLTSKGVFTFQRRKIDTRNRLFYKRSEILQYLESRLGGTIQGGHADPSFRPFAPERRREFEGASAIETELESSQPAQTVSAPEILTQVKPVLKMAAAPLLKATDHLEKQSVKDFENEIRTKLSGIQKDIEALTQHSQSSQARVLDLARLVASLLQNKIATHSVPVFPQFTATHFSASQSLAPKDKPSSKVRIRHTCVRTRISK